MAARPARTLAKPDPIPAASRIGEKIPAPASPQDGLQLLRRVDGGATDGNHSIDDATGGKWERNDWPPSATV
jgi:hypothetical protein